MKEHNKKGLFAGFFSVFSFTAEQNVKGKGFKLSSILIGIAILAVCALIPVLMAVSQQKDDSEDDDYGIEDNISDNLEDDGMMNAIIVWENELLEQGILEDFTQLCGYEDMQIEYSDIDEKDNYQEFAEYCVGNYEHPIGLSVTIEEDTVQFTYYLFENGNVSKELVEGFAESFQMYYDAVKYNSLSLAEAEIELLDLPSWSEATAAGGEDLKIGVMIAQAVVPSLFSLLLFMMVVLYGQSVTKVVMSEKSSKLVEVLLTAVRPYGLIAGKITAVAGIGILQMAVWVVCGIVGFLAGDKAGEAICPDYTNYILEIIHMIQESGTGFSVKSVVLAVLMTLTGFVMYCVWAGFIASIVDKVDDVSSAMAIFQIPVLAGFMISYIGSLMEMDTLIRVSEYVPIVSPFVMPADVLVGKAGFMGGVISFLILLVFTLALILLTGKVYKGKIFNKK